MQDDIFDEYKNEESKPNQNNFENQKQNSFKQESSNEQVKQKGQINNQTQGIKSQDVCHYEMPKSMALQTNLTRLGIVLSNFALIGTLLMLSSFLFFICYAIYYIVLIFATVVTLGLIFLLVPNFSSLFNVPDHIANITQAINTALPIVAPITLISAVASLILLCLNKEDRHVGRIVFSAVLIGIVIIASITLLLEEN